MSSTARHHPLIVGLALALLAWSGAGRADSVEPLPALNIDIKETSVSGLSSGGFMAVQLQVAHSSIIKGAGVIAAGPYWCAQGSALTATTRCSCTLDPAHSLCRVDQDSADVKALVAATRRFARDGLIDDPAHMNRQRSLLVAGGKDKTVPPAVVGQLKDYLVAMGARADNVNLVPLAESGHALPTPAYGSACSVTAAPYINDCDYDAAREVLAWIYGDLRPSRSGARQGRYIRYDQRPYKPSIFGFDWSSGLDETGWVYVPDSCARGEPCRLHVALHGCRQGQSYSSATSWSWSRSEYGTTFVDRSGYDAVADTNRIVVLYPQAVSVMFRNPNGCWDWWGYTDGHYADRQGVQIRAIRAMIERLASGAAR
jgi:poly(3-hydroxybutyrate) depolymerase